MLACKLAWNVVRKLADDLEVDLEMEMEVDLQMDPDLRADDLELD